MEFVFIVCQVEGYKNIVKLSCRLFTFTSFKAFFFFKKKRSEASLPALFSALFFNKNILFSFIPLTDQNSLSGCFYFMRFWAICVLQLFVSQSKNNLEQK